MVKGIYIHIPFCTTKCNYCSFFSVELKKNTLLPQKYIPAICNEIELKAENFQEELTSIYIGGGTPGAIDAKLIAQIVKQCFAKLNISSNYECTIEVNPQTVTTEKIQTYKEAGINRISIGGQSFNERSLAFLGRGHKASDIIRAINICQNGGIENISLDLMFAYKGQTLQIWEEDMRKALSLGVKHISLYDLSIEEGSRFFEEDSKRPLVLSENSYLKMYEMATENIGKKYLHYEISNFAIDSEHVSAHNMLYWGNLSYIGVGAGAFSYENGVRSSNLNDIKGYIRSLSNGKLAIADKEKLSLEKKLRETFVLNLRRLKKGASVSDTQNFCQAYFLPDFQGKLQSLVNEGLLSMDDDTFFLTKRGIVLFNQVAVSLI